MSTTQMFMELMEGVHALQSGKYHQAITHFERSLQYYRLSPEGASPDHEESCYFNLGQAKKATNDYEGAVSEFQKALNKNPKIESAYLLLAECCFQIETYESIEIAINTLNSGTRYFPQNQGAFMNLGIGYLKIGDTDNARIAFNNAKKLGNKDADRFIREYC